MMCRQTSPIALARRAEAAALSAALAVLLSAGQAAHAQTAAADSAGKSDQLEEVVVTAEKRTENVQTVPIAITAFTAQALQERGIQDIHGLGNLTPNVNLDAGSPFSATGSTLAASIRGIGQDDFAMNLDPGVGVYVDGVYLARTVGANQNLLDVDRIEILKGPQGTLFGRNTIGGAISIVTHTPGDHFAGSLEATTGSLERRDFAGTVDIPITPDLLSSFTFASMVRDGYQKRIATPGLPTDFDNIPETTYPQAGYFSEGDAQGGKNQQVMRGKLLFKATDTFRLTLTADWTHEDQEALPNTVLATTNGLPSGGLINLYNTCTAFPNAAAAAAASPPPFSFANVCGPQGLGSVSTPAGIVSTGPALYGRNIPQYNSSIAVTGNIDTSYATGNNFSQMNAWGTALTADWDLSPSMALKAITAYRGLTWRGGMDNDGSALVILEPSFAEGQHQFSEEVQLSGKAMGDRLNYVLGAFGFYETGYIHDFVALDVTMVDGPNNITTSSYAGYAHANYKVTDKFDLTAGARYSVDDKSIIIRQSDPGGFEYKIGGCYPITVACSIALGFPDPSQPFLLFPPGTHRQTFNEFTPTLEADYHFTDDVMGYASYSKGFKTGGWTTRVHAQVLDPNFAVFKPEYANTYEIGLKSELFNHRLRLNSAVFNTAYDNIQLEEQVGPAPTIRNAGNARIIGAELEGLWNIGGGLSLQSALGFMHAYYTYIAPTTDVATIVPVLPEGTPLPKTPKWKLSVAPRYEVPLAAGSMLRFVGNWTHTSPLTNDITATPLLSRGTTDIVDLSGTYISPSGRYELSLGGTNVTDQRYVITGQDQEAGGQVQATFNEPREWYLQLRIKL